MEEQAYILRNSHSVGLVAQDAAALAGLLPHISGQQHASTGIAHDAGVGNGPVRALSGVNPRNSGPNLDLRHLQDSLRARDCIRPAASASSDTSDLVGAG